MAEFINTIDRLGDNAVMDSIIDRTIEEFKDDRLTRVGSYAFYNCTALTEVDLPSVTTIGNHSFYGCTALMVINLPELEVMNDNYGSLKNHFYGCKSLETLIFPKLTQFGNLTSAENCTKLKYVDLYVATNIGAGSFRGCTALKALILRNIQSVVTLTENAQVFKNTPIASGTGYIYVPGNKVQSYMSATNWSTFANQFRGIIESEEIQQGIIDETLINLENNEISSIPRRGFFNYKNIESVKSTSITKLEADAFRGCTSLIEVDLPAWERPDEFGAPSAQFYGCSKLARVNLPNVTSGNLTFNGCTALTEVIMPNLTKAQTMFSECVKLKKLDLPKLTYFDGKFGNWNSPACLDTFILRSPTMCVMGSAEALGATGGSYSNTAIAMGTGYIYVPRALVEEYKAATNWSTYASQFRALEDYTVDGTVTGELDESKI